MTDEASQRSDRLRVQAVNLGLVSWAATEQVPASDHFSLRCECGRRSCNERVLVSRSEYAELTSDFSRAFVAPGHEQGQGLVLERNERFSLVDLRKPPPPLVEVLSMDGCPNRDAALALVHTIAERSGIDVDLRQIRVRTVQDALRLRFLGSPSIRVNGRDVEPGADVRCDYALGCRLYATPDRPSRLPQPEWISTALAAATPPAAGREDKFRQAAGA